MYRPSGALGVKALKTEAQSEGAAMDERACGAARRPKRMSLALFSLRPLCQ